MPYRSPEWFQSAGLILLAVWGGLVNYLQKVKHKGEPFSWFGLFADLLTAAFAGLCVQLLCEAWDIAQPMAAVYIAVSGHMAGRTISLLIRKFRLEDL